MGESKKHVDLVKRIQNVVQNRKDVVPSLVITDNHETISTVPLMPEGFRPDVYYDDCNLIIIGEAKTSNDLFNPHSNAQFESYLKYLDSMSKATSKVALYVGVPWKNYVQVKNHFKKLKPASVDIFIITDFGSGEKI